MFSIGRDYQKKVCAVREYNRDSEAVLITLSLNYYTTHDFTF